MYQLRMLFEITCNLGTNTKANQYKVAGTSMEETLASFRKYIYTTEYVYPHIICIRDTNTSVLIEDKT